ncbi:MAG: type II CAAX endopeptidase family protein [Alphaproteobacteria bacterium]|nr:type II CAAX endopeptidase family protein [Alphaproteobacteria bacterium]MCZ6609487.1 type II CAAX endopeptidase family protein [Alphaproteobacteria bacterium]MCZ6741287.1 type II CAAX endopeptidase family protein [Alphaproteobacteria bacterium]
MPPHPDPTLSYRITIRNFIGITLMSVLIFVIGGVIVVRLDPSIFTKERALLDNLLWFSLLASVGVLASTGYVLASRTAMGWAIIGLTRPEARWVLIAVSVAAALFFAGERLDALMGFGIMESTRASYAATLESEVGLIGLMAVLAIILPISLEIYFRGVLFNFLRPMLGLEAAIGVSALVYGLLFFNPSIPVYMAYSVVQGAVFCLLFVRSGSLWTAIVANGTLSALTIAKVAWA